MTKKALLPQKSYQEESGTRSEPSSFSIIAAETGNNRINAGVNCYITLLVISELKVKNGMLINLHLKKCLTTSLRRSEVNFVSYSKCKNFSDSNGTKRRKKWGIAYNNTVKQNKTIKQSQ